MKGKNPSPIINSIQELFEGIIPNPVLIPTPYPHRLDFC